MAAEFISLLIIVTRIYNLGKCGYLKRKKSKMVAYIPGSSHLALCQVLNMAV